MTYFRRMASVAAVVLSVGGVCVSAAARAEASSLSEITGPAGSAEFGRSVAVLANGNIVVTDPRWSAPGPVAEVGAVRLYDGTTRALISTLTGSRPMDHVGGGGIVTLAGGDFVVWSPLWSTVAGVRGAVTRCDAATGCVGAVTAANSLIGNETLGGVVDLGAVHGLPNGDYVFIDPSTDRGSSGDVGSVTWCSGSAACVGDVSLANSLMGAVGDDKVGIGGVVPLPSGAVLVLSPEATVVGGKDGAVTFCSSRVTCVGSPTVGNSAHGATAEGLPGSVTVLSDGDYVIADPWWDLGLVEDAGAARRCDGAAGCAGMLTDANSLHGSRTSDLVGLGRAVALNDGGYVVVSPQWNADAVPYVGAVTRCLGGAACTGVVSAANSLVGTTASDMVGYDGVTVLADGDYIVASSYWRLGGSANVGAVTWCAAAKGCVGVVSAATSLHGTAAYDNLGRRPGPTSSGTTALTDGRYLVVGKHTVTACDGAGGCVGEASATNSLMVDGAAVTALVTGAFLVTSTTDTVPGAGGSGAVHFCPSGSTCMAPMTSANSLVGASAGDGVGSGGVVALPTGAYVVFTPGWDDAALQDVGAVTWCGPTGGCTGPVSAANSLRGTVAFQTGGQPRAIRATPDGNYVVHARLGPSGSAVSVTLADGHGGSTVGVPSAANTVAAADEDAGTVAYGAANARLVVGRPNANVVEVIDEADGDHDGAFDVADNCVAVANADQIDTDTDGLGNACDLDDDGDGYLDGADAFPLVAAPVGPGDLVAPKTGTTSAVLEWHYGTRVRTWVITVNGATRTRIPARVGDRYRVSLTTLAPGTKVCVTVAGLLAGVGRTRPSNETCTVTSVSSLRATAVSASSITLRFRGSASATYSIIGPQGRIDGLVASADHGALSLVMSGLPAATKGCWQVVAVSGGLESPVSSRACARTKRAPA